MAPLTIKEVTNADTELPDEDISQALPFLQFRMRKSEAETMLVAFLWEKQLRSILCVELRLAEL